MLEEARKQFFQEATVLARLDHPNLPKVSDFFSIEARDYLVMDFVPGKDLRTLMIESRQKDQFLEETQVLNWASQLADALAFLHNQEPPILHRDIKPSNLKVTPTGLVKLVDFGLVKVLAPGEMTITILQGQGTALYTPIEQYGGDGAHTDIRSDIFSFGATLYHLLTNHPPADARERFLDPGALIPPRQINPEVSSQTERAILWAMNIHPDDRPNTIQEVQRVLFGDRPTIPRSITRPPSFWRSAKREPEKVLWAVAASLTIISLVITIF
jgi:serine/threonine-protein kinase